MADFAYLSIEMLLFFLFNQNFLVIGLLPGYCLGSVSRFPSGTGIYPFTNCALRPEFALVPEYHARSKNTTLLLLAPQICPARMYYYHSLARWTGLPNIGNTSAVGFDLADCVLRRNYHNLNIATSSIAEKSFNCFAMRCSRQFNVASA